MECQRCGKNEGEYLCSVCNRIVCSDCKVVDNGKIYCLDHAPRKAQGFEKEPIQGETVPQESPKSLKILKELIYADLILLIGVATIYFISNFLISNLLVSISDVITTYFSQLGLLFALITFFVSGGFYVILFLTVVLIALIIIYKRKKHRYKNI